MQVAQGWSVGIERGPDWLFVNLHREDEEAGEPTALAESLWDLLQCHLGHRMVIELNDIPLVSSGLLGQLVQLSKQINDQRGVLRLCGVSANGEQGIRAARLERLLPCYEDRAAAVKGSRPGQPR